MRILLYKGGFRSVRKSGVGQAILHQEEMLKKAGISLTDHWSEADVIHINTVFPDSLWAALRARRQGKKVVYYGHSTEEDFRHSFCGSDQLAPLFRRWIRWCYSLGDVIITPTAYSKELLQGYGLQNPIYALSNGVDTQYFRPDGKAKAAFRRKYGLWDTDRAVISVGHYIQRKGILDIVELARRMPEVYFFWFGHTDRYLIPNEVRQAIDRAPANLRFPGYVDREELRMAYCGADAFVFLSHEETEGIVVLEALACGIPVILREIPVYDGWLENGRNVCKVSDTAQAETILSRLLAKGEPSLTAAGRRTAEERSLGRIGKQLCEIYRELGFTCPGED